MTARSTVARPAPEAVVWIDHQQAIISMPDRDGAPFVERLGRGTVEPEAAFTARVVDELADAGVVTISGPAFARTPLERAIVSATHRPDLIVDVEPWMDAADTADLPARRRPRPQAS